MHSPMVTKKYVRMQDLLGDTVVLKTYILWISVSCLEENQIEHDLFQYSN